MSDYKITSFKDMLRACCHIEEHKEFPETVLTISTGNLEIEKEIQLDKKASLMNFYPSFYCKEDTLEVNIQFRGHMDSNLNQMLKILKEYQKESNIYYEQESDEIPYPTIQFLFLPLCVRGRYQLLLSDPEFFILCSKDTKSYPDTIKMIFSIENLAVLESDELDYTKILSEIKRQEEVEAFYEAEEEKKRRRDAYEAEMNFNRTRGN